MQNKIAITFCLRNMKLTSCAFAVAASSQGSSELEEIRVPFCSLNICQALSFSTKPQDFS